MLLELQEIYKQFDEKQVLQSVSLEVTGGEVMVLLGPSGCGKTTLLRIIAGLEKPDAGRVLLDGRDLTQVAVHKKGFGLVFQDYALFPHKNVFQNVAFGLRMLRWEPTRIAERVSQALAVVGLSDFESRAIHELSGGERQRVALARSLAPAPRLLLLDEPLGALDRALRERLMLELRSILKEAGSILGRPEGITAVYVTHDQAEAFAVADRVVVMDQGQVMQVGSPHQLYQEPASAFVARFLGMQNIFEAEVVSANPLVVLSPLGELRVNGGSVGSEVGVGAKVSLLIRPEAAQLDDLQRNKIQGRLEAVSFRGRYQMVTLAVSTADSDVLLRFELDSAGLLPEIGSVIQFGLDQDALLLF